jgi:hypothetical protein
MSFNTLTYITSRISELHEEKKGQTMEVKAVLNGSISELEKLKKLMCEIEPEDDKWSEIGEDNFS